MVATLNSHTSAHDGTTTVAPFRAWRGLQIIVAREPKRATVKLARDYPRFDNQVQQIIDLILSIVT